ncbi:nucleoside hydrolase [Bifidobacterium platyrrhinorum]|uniref:Nucleoside hydrolase n=1 Tax=Bifidobacterium platyrrhinorum TaxID=2661628 RepID=A0A6L9SQF1_9BIFI|nr:nucleoside hydrolase [Bifidobacterium platyrrhinorum]NEG54209.1 nucleoside hydrolase [Bifidobacterium platyrrhinorum]
MTDRSPARIIACVDTGVDDAMALAYLLASPAECELAGVLAGYGNVDAATAERNTRLVLDLFGRPDIPVFRSSTHPSWADSFIPDAGCARFHGADGLGGYVEGSRSGTGRSASSADSDDLDESDDLATAVPDAARPDGVVSVGGYRIDDPHANPAGGWRVSPFADGEDDSPRLDGIGFLIDQVRRYGRGVTVLATGPLTDMDAAIGRAPDIAGKLRLVMMGGTLSQPGNCWDAVAETNVIQDPEAADRVLHSGADVTMVGLDVTHRCLLPSKAADRWRSTGTERGRFLARLADFSIAANLEADPAIFAGGMPLHDPLAAAVALDPTLVSTFGIALRAETATGDFTGVRGRTTGDPVGLVTPDAPRVHVALDVDADRFTSRFVDRLAALCAA